MTLKNLIIAARPKTLPAAIIPVVLGCFLTFHFQDSIDYPLAVYTFLAALFIQIATNFFNDAIDADNGADTEKRLGPKRVTSSGLMTRSQVFLMAYMALFIAMVFGVLLTLDRGWIVLVIGIPSLYLSYGYTGGPFPLAYRGMGEIFVLLFFGWIATIGTVFIQTGEFYMEAALLGTQLGLLSAVIILVNNIRDREEDAESKKKTIVVKFGVKFALLILYTMTVVCYSIGALWFFYDFPLLAIVPLVVIFIGIYICIGVSKSVKDTDGDYNKYLGVAALQLVVFAILWSVTLFI